MPAITCSLQEVFTTLNDVITTEISRYAFVRMHAYRIVHWRKNKTDEPGHEFWEPYDTLTPWMPTSSKTPEQMNALMEVYSVSLDVPYVPMIAAAPAPASVEPLTKSQGA